MNTCSDTIDAVFFVPFVFFVDSIFSRNDMYKVS